MCHYLCNPAPIPSNSYSLFLFHWAPDTDPTTEAFAALVLTPDLILLDLLAPQESSLLLPVILTSVSIVPVIHCSR